MKHNFETQKLSGFAGFREGFLKQILRLGSIQGNNKG